MIIPNQSAGSVGYRSRTPRREGGFVIPQARNTGGGGGGASCTSRCQTEKDNCRNGCDADPDAGYFCYFDCRLTYMACLASCIGGGGGGGIFMA
jgi:hypothetical protein